MNQLEKNYFSTYQSNVKTFTNPGGVEIITTSVSEDQNVNITSADGSTNNNPTLNEVRPLTTDLIIRI